MKNLIYLLCFCALFSSTLTAQTKKQPLQQKKTTSPKNKKETITLGELFEAAEKETQGVDLGKLMDAMESDEAAELGKKADTMEKSMEQIERSNKNGNGSVESDLNEATAFLKQLTNNSNLPASEKAKLLEMAKIMQATGPSSMEYAKALSEDGKLERKGALLEALPEGEFRKQQAFVDYFYTSEYNPNATLEDRRKKFNKYIDAAGGATPREREIFFRIFEAERNGPDKTYSDIKITENGEEISLKETMQRTAKETGDEIRENHRKMKNKYKNMSFEEFQKEFDMPVPPEHQHEKDKFVRELYREVQNNGGDMLKALNVVMKKYERK